MRFKKPLLILTLALLALLILPVMVKQVLPSERRHYEWVSLDETVHREITFRNAAQDLLLAGMLFVPEGDGPFAAAVIIHGSGTSMRDNGWYLTLTRYLQGHGIVVLLPDKRGSERSEGSWRTASYADLATDTVAAIEFLETQGDVAVADIGVIGLSQGGRIAPIIAAQRPDIAFVVNIVGGAVPAHDALVYEETHNLREMGFLPGIADVLAYPAAWSLIYIRQKAYWDASGNFDPLPWWRRVAVPAFVLFGANDTNVPSHESANRLRSLGKSNITVRVYDGSGHALEDPPGRGNSVFRSDALEHITDFVHGAAGHRYRNGEPKSLT